jgi:hypothetical protein
MKFRLLTLFSVILALVIKTYSLNAKDGVIDDEEIELLAQWELINRDDSLRHAQHIELLAEELAQSNRITEAYTGVGALIPCDTYQRYKRLKRAANADELNRLMLHKSPIIRVYAHRALVERSLSPNPDMMTQIAGDSTEVLWLNGDLLVHTTVMDMVSENLFMPIAQQDSLLAESIPVPEVLQEPQY